MLTGRTGFVWRKRPGMGQANIKVSPSGQLIDCTYPQNVINYNCIFGTSTAGTATAPSALDILNQQPLLSSYDVSQQAALYSGVTATPPSGPASSANPLTTLQANLAAGDPTTTALVLGAAVLLIMMAAR